MTITLLDGLVVARTAFNSSMNYRSVVIFGHGRLIDDDTEKLAALAALTEHLLPGRWQEVRPTTQKELDATTVVAITMESASAKVRTGPPHDDEADLALPIWAGVLPLRLRRCNQLQTRTCRQHPYPRVPDQLCPLTNH